METRNQSAVLTELHDDGELIALATPPAQIALPILDQAAGMFPLVVLFALIPGVWAMLHAGLSDMSALWGLRSLELLSSETFREAIAADGTTTIPASVRFAPPLANWCTGASLWLCGTGIVGLLFPAWVFVAGTIAAAFGIAQRLGGNRAAVLTTLLVGCHGEILRLAQEPSPYSAGLCFALCTLWAAAEHWHRSRGMISLQLLFGGVSLGLCLLSAGLFFVVVLLPLALLAISYAVHQRPSTRPIIPRRRLLIPSTLTQPIAIMVLTLTGFAVGGWWEMMMFGRYGLEFSAGYCDFFPGTLTNTVATARFIYFPVELPRWSPFLLGFAGLGIWQAIRELSPTTDEGCDPPRFLLLWLAASVLCWSAVANSLPSNAPPVALCRAFVLFPFVILAIRGMLGLSDRTIRWEFGLGVLVFQIALIAWALRPSWSMSENALIDAAFLLFVLIPLTGLVFRVVQTSRVTDTAQRRCLTPIIVSFLAGSCVVGLRSVSHTPVEAHSLWAFGAELQELQGVERISLLTRVDPPPQIQFLTQGLWPGVPVKRFKNWTEALEDSPERVDASHLFVVWTRFEVRGGALPETATIRPVATTRLYEGRELNAYMLNSTPIVSQSSGRILLD